MEILDLKKILKYLYVPSAKIFSIVEVPPMNFIMIDGQGDPNTSQEYTEAIQALYAGAYTLRFKVKKELGAVYPVRHWKVCGGRMTCASSVLTGRRAGGGR